MWNAIGALVVVFVFGGYWWWRGWERRQENRPASMDNPYGKGHDDAAHDRTD